MKKIGTIIAVIAVVCFFLSSCGGEPGWKQTLATYESALSKLEGLADKVKKGDEEAVKEAKKVIEDFMETAKDAPEPSENEQKEALAAMKELEEKYQNGYELMGSNLDSYIEAAKALKDALALLPDFEKLAGELEDLVKKYKGGDMAAGAQAQAKQKELEALYGKLMSYRAKCTDDGKKQIDTEQGKLLQQYPFLQDQLKK